MVRGGLFLFSNTDGGEGDKESGMPTFQKFQHLRSG